MISVLYTSIALVDGVCVCVCMHAGAAGASSRAWLLPAVSSQPGVGEPEWGPCRPGLERHGHTHPRGMPQFSVSLAILATTALHCKLRLFVLQILGPRCMMRIQAILAASSVGAHPILTLLLIRMLVLQECTWSMRGWSNRQLCIVLPPLSTHVLTHVAGPMQQ